MGDNKTVSVKISKRYLDALVWDHVYDALCSRAGGHVDMDSSFGSGGLNYGGSALDALYADVERRLLNYPPYINCNFSRFLAHATPKTPRDLVGKIVDIIEEGL